MPHLSTEVPEFVTLSGRKTAFVDLPLGTQQALIRSIQQNALGSELVTVESGSSIQAINAELNAIGRTDPRRASQLRTKLINAGVKGTGLFLGTASPEVIEALRTQASIQNDPVKAQAITDQADLLISEGRVSNLVNTSNLSKEVVQARAKTIFSKQQSFTKAVNSQVRVTLDSPEFIQAKQSGATLGELNTIINRNVTPASKLNSAIVNELAQTEIQGRAQTESNIQSLLERVGIRTNVTVSPDSSALGFNFTSSQPEVTNQITSFIGSLNDLSGIDFIPAGIEELSNNPFVSGDTVLGLEGGLPEVPTDISGGLFDGIGELINSIFDTGLDNQTLGLVALLGAVGILILFIGVIPK